MTANPLQVAIVYDFDGTLAPGNMHDARFIPAVGMTRDEFWQRVRHSTKVNQSDPTLAYMQVMLETARENNVRVTRDDMAHWAQNLQFFPGIPDWFQRIRTYGNGKMAHIGHYIISSGNTEIISATRVAPYVDAIFGSRFTYDAHGAAVWPAEAITFTTKTQYLFRINKGALRTEQIQEVNDYLPQRDRPYPFENIIYIGDGETDIPCFSLIEDKGGLAIAVHAAGRQNEARTYLRQKRVNAIAEADYRPESTLDRLIKRFIDLAVARHRFHTEARATHNHESRAQPTRHTFGK